MPSFLVINKSCLIDFSPLPPLRRLLFSESQRTGGEGREIYGKRVDKLRDESGEKTKQKKGESKERYVG